MSLADTWSQGLGAVQALLFQSLVLPVLHRFGMDAYVEDAFDGVENLLYGIVEIAVLVAVLGVLERQRRYERWERTQGVGTDVVYTLLHRLGIFPLLFFFAFQPLFDAGQSLLHRHGIPTSGLESWLPALAAHPVLSFAAYLCVIDFAKYWIHRAQHRFEWWWALHALHHSQRQMTFWTDDRNHLLDSVLTDSLLALLALLIGVAPAQFAALVVAARLVESLSHANVRLGFGWLGERLLVSPRFHRRHHGIAAGRRGRHHGSNFAVLFPVWDLLFGTADFDSEPGPTGIEDQLAGRDYGQGFWRQQCCGLSRLRQALAPGSSVV